MKYIIGRREVRKIHLPKPGSHKGENGRLLVIAGNRQYHGSLLFAVKAASRIVDLIYIWSTKENQKLVAKLKGKTAVFIPVSNIPKGIDCILIGPGMGAGRRTYKLVRQVLKSGIRAVLDADALKVLDAKLLKPLNHNHILTPHAGEFRNIFGVDSNFSTAKIEAMKYGCTILLKGRIDIVASPEGRIGLNATGNAGMTKGGTGDVLAGLVAAFFCRNDAYTAAAAGVYVNGLAGDELYKKVGPHYDAEDLVEQVPRTVWGLLKGKK